MNATTFTNASKELNNGFEKLWYVALVQLLWIGALYLHQRLILVDPGRLGKSVQERLSSCNSFSNFDSCVPCVRGSWNEE